ncbi:MAG TPA: thiopurine S-methyltransferase [Alphaproteobacteria bacterium]|nr:thiopurine S-methyltransferase [Alphaproteobacteria bacterium]
MEAEFWHRKWARNEIGFHNAEAHPLLVVHFGALALSKGRRVFLPLCGKTRDIHWLLANGYRVAGAELSSIAVEQLFAELGAAPKAVETDEMRRYSADGIDIFAGDIFALSRATLGPVDAVYDRAALVALPKEMRGRSAAHLAEITGRAPQLLISFDYDQTLLAGPPFSVPGDEIARLYRDAYDPVRLGSAEVEGGLKGKCPAEETVWLLRPVT